MAPMTIRRLVVLSCTVFVFILVFYLQTETGGEMVRNVKANVISPVKDRLTHKPAPPAKTRPSYKPGPPYTPPPVKDNFPLLATSKPPPIPSWNVPRANLHKEYGLAIPPPLLIGFTRSWPILLQAVVSYITAGWPADQIYVIENTGVQQANTHAKIGLQNPFFLNHTVLKDQLGVKVVQTPALLSFAQLQNFYLSVAISHDWPFYFWGHMDTLALSYEDGNEHTPPYNQPGYQSLYELACKHAGQTIATDNHWGLRFFAYDHLALVNPVAYEDVGGWDTLIPYYMTDCDMHSRLTMRNWTQQELHAGIITDTGVTLDNLLALYRDKTVEVKFTDPNPPAPPLSDARAQTVNEVAREIKWHIGAERRALTPPSTQAGVRSRVAAYRPSVARRDDAGPPTQADVELEYWRSLLRTADSMFHYKHGERGRNTWQQGQRGGKGEPFYYDAAGFAEAIDVLTEAGREVFRRKWGHRDCDLITGAGLAFDDQWLVEKDWS